MSGRRGYDSLQYPGASHRDPYNQPEPATQPPRQKTSRRPTEQPKSSRHGDGRTYDSSRGYRSEGYEAPTAQATSSSHNRVDELGYVSSREARHSSRARAPSIAPSSRVDPPVYATSSKESRRTTQAGTSNAPQSQHQASASLQIPSSSQGRATSRASPTRMQPDDPRTHHTHKRYASAPTPQSSSEQVSKSADKSAEPTRSGWNIFSKTPFTRDILSSAKRSSEKEAEKVRDRERSRERSRDRDRDRERLKELEREQEREKDRDKERRRRRQLDALERARESRTASKDDRPADSVSVKGKEKEVQDRRDDGRSLHREHRSVTKPAQASSSHPTHGSYEPDAYDGSHRLPAPSTSSHRRYRTEEGTAATSSARRPEVSQSSHPSRYPTDPLPAQQSTTSTRVPTATYNSSSSRAARDPGQSSYNPRPSLEAMDPGNSNARFGPTSTASHQAANPPTRSRDIPDPQTAHGLPVYLPPKSSEPPTSQRPATSSYQRQTSDDRASAQPFNVAKAPHDGDAYMPSDTKQPPVAGTESRSRREHHHRTNDHLSYRQDPPEKSAQDETTGRHKSSSRTAPSQREPSGAGMNPRTDNPVTNHDDNPRAAASSRTHYAEVQTSASTGRKPAQTANELQVPNAGLKVERTPSDQDSLRRQTRSTSTPAPESSYAPRKESRRSERATDPPSLSKASHSKSDNSFVNPTNSRSHSLAKQYDQPSGAQQFVSIRAAQGPSDPRKFYGLFKASEEPQQGVSSTPAPVMKSRSQADDPSSRSQAQSSSRHHSRDRDADRPEPTGMSTSSASAKPVRSQESQQNAASAEMSTARTTGSHRYAPSVEPSGSKRSHDTPLAEPSTTVAKDDAPLRSSHSRTKDAVKPSPRDDSVPSRSKQGSSSQVEPTAAPAATSSFPSDNGASKPLLSVPTNGRSIRKVSFKLESEEIPYSSKYPAQTFDSPAESTSKALPADQHAASASSSQPVVDSGSADRPRGDDSQPPQTERKTGPQDISAQPVDSTTVLHRAEAAAPALSGRTSQDSRVEEPHVQANGGHSAQPSSDSPLRQDRADPASQHNDHASYVPRNRSDDRGLDADRDSAKRDLRTADGPNANAQNVARPSDPQSIGNVDSSRTGRDRQRDEPETKGAGKESGSKSARSRKSRSKPQSKDEPDGPSSKADPPPAHSGSAPIHHGGLRDVLAYTPSTSNAVPNGHAHVNIHPAASGPDEQRGVRAINATASSSAVSLAAALPTTNSHTGASSLHPSSAEKRPDRPSPRSNDSGSTPSPSARVRNADSKSSKEPSPSALSNGLSMPVESTTYRSSPSGFPDPYMPQTYDSVNGPAPLSPLILSQPGIDTTPEPLPHRLDIRERSRHSPVDVEVRNVPIAGPSQASDVHAPTRPPGIPAYSTLNENSLQPPRPNYDTLQEVYATTEVHHGKDSRHPYNPQPSPEKLQSAQPTAPSTNPNPTTQETTLRAYARPDESHAPIRYPASPLYRTPSRTTYPEAPITAQNTYVSYSRPEVPPRMESRNALPTEYPNSSYTHMPYVPNAPQTQPTPSPYVPEKISRRPSATGYVPTVPTVPSPRPPSKPAASSRPEDAVDSRSRGPTAPSVPWPVPTTEPPQPKYTTPQAPYYQAPFSHDVAAPTPTHLLASGILPPKARSQSHENSIQPSVAKPTNYRPQPAYTSTRVPNSRRNFLAVPMDRDCSMSNESDVLKTPSSLAPSTHPTPNPPAPSPSPNPSRESRKKGGFLGMFRSKASTPEPYQPAPAIVSRPPMPVPKHRNIVPERSNGHVSHAAPVVPSRTRKDSGTKINIFSAFRLGKKNHTLSNASVDAQDGTATNTIVGSPTHSGLSQPPAYQPPPVRDPLTAAQEWRDREEMMGRGSGRRRRPGVVFDVGEDRPGVRQTTRPPSRSRGR